MPEPPDIVVLTGAGISRESGLATFRDADGAWARVRIEDVATPAAFARDPARVHGFYNARRAQLADTNVMPNAAHRALATLERRWPGAFLLVTQNVDNLHERAGSRRLVHMHGELLRARCNRCGTSHAWIEPLGTDTLCPACFLTGGMRPDIVWFGEMRHLGPCLSGGGIRRRGVPPRRDGGAEPGAVREQRAVRHRPARAGHACGAGLCRAVAGTMDVSTALDEVAAAARACTHCTDLPLGPRPVLRVSATARLLIVGQAPGTRVHATGVPWNDPSGDRLRDWLGLTRAVFYDAARVAIVPMGLCYPGRLPRGGDAPPRAVCAPLWQPRLLPLLTGVRLTLLVGSYAQTAFLGPGSMTERVRAAQAQLPRFLPLPHPSWRTIGWEARNPWFAAAVLPLLRAQVALALG